MRVILGSIKDELSDMAAFAPPMPFEDEDNAKRFFQYKQHTDEFMKVAPNDYSMWKIGEMDLKTGEIFPTETKYPVLIERGSYNGDKKNMAVPNTDQ